MLLKDGLGGNSRTVLVGTIGPTDASAYESVSTLRFVDRAKQIKNKPTVQMDPKDAKIADLLEQVKKLRRQLGLDESEDAEGEDAEPTAEDKMRRESKVKLYDDELEALRRRNEELEVALEAAKGTIDNGENEIAEQRARERQCLKDSEEREAKLKEELAELKDQRELNNCSNDDAIEKLRELMSMCTSFLASIDKDHVWIPTVASEASTEEKPPTSVNSGRLVLNPSFDDIVRGFKMFVGNGVEMRLQPIKRTSFYQSPHPPVEPSSAAPQAAFTRERDPRPSNAPTPSDLTPAGATNDAEGRKRKDKKKKELTSAAISSTLDEANLNNDAVRTVVEALLAKQRKIMYDALKRDASSLTSAMDSAELAAAYEQLTDELDRMNNGNAKLRQQLAKAKTMAERKMEEVGQLKEHIQALRDELAAKHQQHAAELSMAQDRLVTQNNKKMEQLMAKHAKAMNKERKQREAVQQKVEQLQTQVSSVEQEYDVKLMEFESLQHDYEQLKIENLKKFKEMGGFATLTQQNEVEKLRQAVNATKSRGAPKSAPEGNEALISSLPSLPTQLRTPQTGGLFSKNCLDIPRK